MTPSHFFYYLLFEENLALNLNNLVFPLPKDDLCKVWLKLACWSWRRRFFFYINMVFPIPPPLHDVNNSESALYQKVCNDKQQVIRIAHLRFWLRWAENICENEIQWHLVISNSKGPRIKFEISRCSRHPKFKSFSYFFSNEDSMLSTPYHKILQKLHIYFKWEYMYAQSYYSMEIISNV